MYGRLREVIGSVGFIFVETGGHFSWEYFVALPLPINNPILPTQKTQVFLRHKWPASYPPTSVTFPSRIVKDQGKWQELKSLLLTQSVAASWRFENWEVARFRWKDLRRKVKKESKILQGKWQERFGLLICACVCVCVYAAKKAVSLSLTDVCTNFGP